MATWISATRIVAGCGACAIAALALDLQSTGDFIRPDPFGGIVKADRVEGAWKNDIKLAGARRSYVSAHLVIKLNRSAEYAIEIQSSLPVDAYREWFHRNTGDGNYYPDALVPISGPYRSHMPEPDNRIPNQIAQAFWLDFWIPQDAKPGTYRGNVTARSGPESKSVPIEITVFQDIVPETDAVILDHNSYGTSWMFEQYPQTLDRTDEDGLFKLIHAYHRVFHEHRGIFHQLGYGHAGKVGPEFAPELSGTGRTKRVSSWDRFDRHYGPLLDGSAFKNSKLGDRPIPFVYLPINPDWPASYLWAGEPGYEVEFRNVVSAMEQHFRQKGWTSTNFEVFFNQKKRYKGFSWDGDEIRFPEDNKWLVTFRQFLDRSIPKDSPVHFVTRIDTSWSMGDQFSSLKNVINFWVAGEGMLSWYSDIIPKLIQRGDKVWSYGGTPPVDHSATEITLNPLRSWISGVQGFVRWQTVDPGKDPWYALGGGGETLVYPGNRFGIAEPLASVRLKLERNCLQDLALLNARSTGREQREALFSSVTRLYNGLPHSEWRNTPPALLQTPVLDWNNLDIEEALRPFEEKFSKPAPNAWTRIHALALGMDGANK